MVIAAGILKQVRLDGFNPCRVAREFSLSKPFDLLRDENLVPLSGASETPVELFLRSCRENAVLVRALSSNGLVGPSAGRETQTHSAIRQ